MGGRQGLSRDRIESYLWPESSGAVASHALDQTVYAIRHALGRDFILSTGRELRLNAGLVQVDVWEFEEAIRTGQWVAAVGHYKGPLLDGFHFADSRELESWIDAERARLRLEYQTALEALANVSADGGDHSQSVTWWRRLATSDPLSASATKKLMLALAAAGDRAGAVKHARLYQELVRQDLEIEPDSEIESLAASFSHSGNAETVLSPAVEKALQGRSGSPGESANALNDLSGTPSVAGETLGTTSRRRERVALYALIPVAILMSGAAIWGWMRPSPSKPVVRYTVVVDSTQAIANGNGWSGRLALSPDGSRLAYIGGPRSQLLIRPFNQLRAVAVPESEGVTTPFFSPDGSRVGYLEEEKIRIMSISGGPPITVSDTLTGVAGASWGPDNSIYVDASENTGLLRVEATRGSKPSWFTVLDTASGEYDHNWPNVLPNGNGVLFTVTFRRTGAKGTILHAIAVADIPSGKHRVIVDDAMYPRYSTSGHLLYVTTNKTLMVVPFDQNSMKATGDRTALAEGMRLGAWGSADLAVSATGTLIYTTGAGQGNHELVWVTRDGKTQPVDPDWQSGVPLFFPALSPDGKWVAVARSTPTEPVNIWIKRLDRGESRKLTLEGKYNICPTWTPDGGSVTFSSEPATGAWDLWTKRADGSAQAVLQFHEKRSLFVPRWSPDGTWLIFHTDPAQPGAGDILGLRPGIDTVPVALVVTKFTEVAPALSPDGRWLAYASNETGRFETYVVPFPNTSAAKWAISSDGGTEPLWAHSGSEFFYRDASQNFVAVDVKTKPIFSVGRSTLLFSAVAFNAYNFAPLYAVAADDQRFIMSRPANTSAPDKLIVVQNWFEELRAKSPK